MLLPDKREALIVGGAVIGVALLLWFASTKAGQAVSAALGKTLAQGAVSATAGVASGAVIGVGSAVGLPDTTDAATVGKGRAALAAGDWLTASLNLPAPEFLAAVKAKLFGTSTTASTNAAPNANQTIAQPGATDPTYYGF